jgi:hypothetical protein
MKASLNLSQITLRIIARTRGVRADDLLNHPLLHGKATSEGLRKKLDRMVGEGLLQCVSLPHGSKIYFLSRRSADQLDAPPAFAKTPTQSVMGIMLATSSLIFEQTYQFLSQNELSSVIFALGGEPAPTPPGQFLLRTFRVGQELETHLHFFLGEIRTVEALAKRVVVTVEKLSELKFFRKLMELSLFGITIAVPSQGVKESLSAIQFSIPVDIAVVNAMQDLTSLQIQP